MTLLFTLLLSACEMPIEEEALVDNKEGDNTNSTLPVDDFIDFSEDEHHQTIKKRFYWNQANLPIRLTTSHELDPSYRKVINDMARKWEAAAGLDLIKTGKLKKNVEYSKLESYLTENDDFGIYVAFKPVEGISSRSLAVTQVIVKEVSRTKDTINYEIQHGDIVFNKYDFDFSIHHAANTFDFGSVILHELGHLIGLLEHRDTKDSVMYPTITEEEVVNELFKSDMDYIRSLYSGHSRTNKHYSIDESYIPSDGELFRIVIEHKVDGTHTETFTPL